MRGSAGSCAHQRKKLAENVMLQGIWGCSYHEMLEFEILCAVRKTFSKLAGLTFRRAYFGLLRGLLGGVLWDGALESRGAQECSLGSPLGECSLIFKDHLFQIQEWQVTFFSPGSIPGDMHR